MLSERQSVDATGPGVPPSQPVGNLSLDIPVQDLPVVNMFQCQANLDKPVENLQEGRHTHTTCGGCRLLGE